MKAHTYKRAILERKFSYLPSSPCKIITSDDELYPRSVVEWRIKSPSESYIVLDKTLLSSELLGGYATRLALTMPIIEAGHLSRQLSAGTILLNLGDISRGPGIAFCSTSDDNILVPDSAFMKDLGYKEWRDEWNRNSVPWRDRRTDIFWRGSTTGLVAAAKCLELPRLVLCRMAAKRPDLFDVGVSRVSRRFIGEVEFESEIRAEDLMKPYVPDKELSLQRYHIDIDGNSSAWKGLFLKLLSGSPVLKIASPTGFRQWYYHRLVPWENFVPVRSDMADLYEKAEWLKQNDADAQRIGESGRALAETMTYENEISEAVARIALALRNGGNGGPR